MIFANCGCQSDLFDVAQEVGSDIRAAGMVAEVLGKLLFMAIRSRNAGVDGYLRNGKTPFRYSYL
jgi:hypothetical protein